ncbi:MAG: NAD-dependent malic enzyme [SAR324 cluster bacterium]|uniref:NAD-dependent malic enzyme n=1 Tax=SAR324 cluster bacterium TaxID=2024889 RepID=A0A7X9FPN9_9DELT|nr:NAD-dependent malic enzyme [SAR324 cluster bacterium]
MDTNNSALKLHPSAGNSITLTLKIRNIPGQLAEVIRSISETGASLTEITLLSSDFHFKVRELSFNCINEEHALEVVDAAKRLENVEILSWKDDTFALHEGGKLSINPKQKLKNADELSRSYTPGVARVCLDIFKKEEDSFKYTIKSHTIAIVTDGSAVLGLGNIGPEAALPVMEGKAVLFKQFGGVDAFPICLASQDTEDIIKAVKLIEPVFGGINLEDISAPRCFEIEERLKNELKIPVFHDDQHGTAVVVLAGLHNALKIVGKKLEDIKIVINGFGAGGVACAKILLNAGAKNITACDTNGIIYKGRPKGMNSVKEEMLKYINKDNMKGTLSDALRGADMFLGVSAPGALTRDMVKSMAKDPIVFSLANPIPEIMPDLINDIAGVIATGRSDYPNQINNVLCFPGIFKGALACRATKISEEMKKAAALAIAESIPTNKLSKEYIIPGVFDFDIGSLVAEKVIQTASKHPSAPVC